VIAITTTAASGFAVKARIAACPPRLLHLFETRPSFEARDNLGHV
jgi:hypothetical protein